MLVIFPMNFKMIRNSLFHKLIIRIGGKVDGTQGLATKQICELAKSARMFDGKPMRQALVLRPQYGEEFVVGIQLEFKTRRLMNEFMVYVLTNPPIGGS